MESLKLAKGKLLMACFGVVVVAIIATTVFKVAIGNLLFFAVLAACPLMHVFMMKGHGGHKQTGDDKKSGKAHH